MFLIATAFLTKVIGITAGVFTGASLLPQVVKMIREKKATQISLGMIVVLMAGLSLWIWYGALKEDWPIIITNAFSLALNGIMIYLRFRYGNK